MRLVSKCAIEDQSRWQRRLGERCRSIGILINPHKLGKGVRRHGDTKTMDLCKERLRGIGVGHKTSIELANDRDVHRAFYGEILSHD